jgi:DNA invertase Pin-like site-specific DNA recombinase
MVLLQYRGMKYGHIRVSTNGQSFNDQVRRFTHACCQIGFRDVESGTKTDRRQFRHVFDHRAPGDVLMVTGLTAWRDKARRVGVGR